MKFIKDLLLFDIETSGPDPERDVIVQFAAVLLDKDNLLEKAYFSTYVKNSLLQETLKEHARNAHVDFAKLQTAPKSLDFLKQLQAHFPASVTLAMPSPTRLLFLRQAFRKQSSSFPYDLTLFDLWTLYYVYGMRMGLRKIPTLHTLSEHFNLPLDNPYNAFERVKLHAEVLKRVCREL